MTPTGNPLSEGEREALNELAAISEHEGWIATRRLSGTKTARSSRTLLSLVAKGLAENRRYGTSRQAQYSWRILPAGHAALSQDEGA